MIRAFKVYYEYDAFDVESTSTDACRYHDIPHSFFKVVDCELTIGMIHGSVQDEAVVSILDELFQK